LAAAQVAQLAPEKDQVRRRIWEAMQEQGVARFPGAWGRIPNFTGAEQAARRLAETDVWRAANVIKCNPDSPQLPVRVAALEAGKTVYMAVPRLRQAECFIELDPAALDVRPRAAASIKGSFHYGSPVTPDDVRPIDLVVCGSVAVSADGSRLGKGGGYSDLEFAILHEFGKLGGDTPVVTTVHVLQLVDEFLPMRPHDLSLDLIVTSEEVVFCRRTMPRPEGVLWDILPRERIDEIPILKRLLADAAR
jgi:5-formyltetrahydrofolate cyclo-ligase